MSDGAYPLNSKRQRSGLLGLLSRLLRNQHALSWADQIAVSGLAFVALIVVSAGSGLGELGVYALCVSVIALGLAAQEALVTRPYVVHLQGVTDPTAHAASALTLSLALGLVSALVLTGLSLPLAWLSGWTQAASATLALAAAIPFALIREFARRFAFARQRPGRALALDIWVVLANLVLLAILAGGQHLNAVTAVLAAGFSCATGAGAWFLVERGQFRFCRAELGRTTRRSWGMGRWLLAAQSAMHVQGYATQWLTMVLAGPVVTGAFAACTSVVAFANPLLFGFLNIMIPQSARVFHASGRSGLLHQAIRDALLLGGMMGAFCIVLGLAGSQVLSLLFPEAASYGGILTLLGLASAAAAMGIPASTALASADRPHLVAAVTGASAMLHVGLVYGLLNAYGLTGAALGVLIAEVVGSLSRWGAFLRCTPKAAFTPAPAE